MKQTSIFDIISPIMIGPSSSHTAGAVRLGLLARNIYGETPKRVIFKLFNSYAQTGKGHGTEKGLLAGVLGLSVSDRRIKNIFEDEISKNIDYKFEYYEDFKKHPNAVDFVFENGRTMDIYGESNAPAEVFNCICSEPLKYSKRFYAQQGHYYCDKCNYQRPKCNYSAKVKIYDNYSILCVNNHGIDFEFKVNLVGLYNAYNALAAISTAFENGLNQSEIQKALDSYHSIFGRTETRIINGHKTLIQLIKNPAGASEVLKTVDLNSNILIAINDDYADGRDISWLWDSDFEQLKEAKKLVVTSGKRAYDMATRLKYAGIPQEKIVIEPDVKKAVKLVSTSTNKEDNITILPSYTALLKISKY